MALGGLGQASIAEAQAPRLVRSISGASGKIVGSQFVFDETRSRFVYPQDRTVTVYFEWEFLPGDHVLTATWKQPDGRVASVSPDVKIQTTSNELNCYWIFNVTPNIPNGAWTVEIRIDGQPAGSHAFELAGVDIEGGRFTLDRVFTSYGPSIVRIHKIDDAGRHVDVSSGFVIAPNSIATAFQAIDAAQTLEIEFSDGRRVPATEILAFSRLGDWAVLKADAHGITPIPRLETPPVPVGSTLAAFSVDSGTRVMAPVNVGGVSAPAGQAARIRFAPDVSAEAVGGPLIDEQGRVVGIVGGSVTPGARVDQRTWKLQPLLWRELPVTTSATSITDLPATVPTAGRSLDDLRREGVMTLPISVMTEFVSGGTVAQLPKGGDRGARQTAEFSASDDALVGVYVNVVKKVRQISRGELSATVFDPSNRVRLTIPAKRITLRDQEQRVSFTLPPKGLPIGDYRIDVNWDGKPAWRTYIRIVR
jgi:S1-C subfamily serine protease